MGATKSYVSAVSEPTRAVAGLLIAAGLRAGGSRIGEQLLPPNPYPPHAAMNASKIARWGGWRSIIRSG